MTWLAVLAASSLSATATALHLPLKVYTPRTGLPQAQVSAVLQDQRGFLWVATRAGGIGRFDGRSWTVFDTSAGLPSAGVEALDMSPSGTLFAGTNGGAARRNGRAWMALDSALGVGSLPVSAILALADDDVLVGSSAGLQRWTGRGPATSVNGTSSLAGARVACLARGGSGTVWVGTSLGLGRVDAGTPDHLTAVAGLPHAEVRAVLERPGHGLLVAVEGVGLFTGEPGRFARVGDDVAPGRHVRALLAEQDEPGSVWVGTDELGVFHWRAGRWTRLAHEQGMPTDNVLALCEDREGVLWFGTDDGLVKRAPAAFATYSTEDGFPDGARVYGMTETPDGSLWFAAYKGGVVRLRPGGQGQRFTNSDGLPDASVNDVEPDPAGGVWVATRRGLARIDGGRVRMVTLPAGAPTALRTLAATPEGALYIGTFHDGLVVLEHGELRHVGPPVGPVVAALYRAPDGTVWCGGEGWRPVGLRPNGEPIVLGAGERIPPGQVNGFLEDSRGTLWIATERGAWRRDRSGAISILDRSSGLPDSYVYWVAEDRERAIWFGTNHGAARLTQDGRWEVYTSRDGLASDECNEDGVLVDSRGRLFIGSVGVSVFLGPPHPVRRVPPPILLEEVRAGSQTIERPQELTLAPGQGPLSFRLASPSFVSEDSTRVRYRLSGLTETWSLSEPGQLDITFGGLGYGHYSFEALAVTGDGRVSEVPVDLAVTVRPRWWQSPAFIVVVSALLAIAVVATIRTRERALEVARRRLELQVQARTEELRQANERLAEQAIRDDLTDLPNRRAVLERLREAMSSARRHNRSLAVAMIDLDGFKKVNDVYGHEVGDQVLHRVAAAMREGQREEDTLGRYGGDEFLAVMPGCDEAGAVQVATRLQEAVAAVEVPEIPGAGGRAGLSISVGIAVFDDTVADGRELVRRADDLLYRSKLTRSRRSNGTDHLAG